MPARSGYPASPLLFSDATGSPPFPYCTALLYFQFVLFRQKKTGEGHVGSGGMADTRDPDPVNHEDPRKSISAAPSFEEYLKSKRN